MKRFAILLLCATILADGAPHFAYARFFHIEDIWKKSSISLKVHILNHKKKKDKKERRLARKMEKVREDTELPVVPKRIAQQPQIQLQQPVHLMRNPPMVIPLLGSAPSSPAIIGNASPIQTLVRPPQEERRETVRISPPLARPSMELLPSVEERRGEMAHNKTIFMYKGGIGTDLIKLIEERYNIKKNKGFEIQHEKEETTEQDSETEKSESELSLASDSSSSSEEEKIENVNSPIEEEVDISLYMAPLPNRGKEEEEEKKEDEKEKRKTPSPPRNISPPKSPKIKIKRISFNIDEYVLAQDPYALHPQNRKPPKVVNSQLLELFNKRKEAHIEDEVFLGLKNETEDDFVFVEDDTDEE